MRISDWSSDVCSSDLLAERQAESFAVVRGLATDLAATFGPAPAERLQGDWSDYVARVDGFAVTRGWLLLDPALSRTRLGAAARAEAAAVDRAAAIGSASCRERVCQCVSIEVVAVLLKKNDQ